MVRNIAGRPPEPHKGIKDEQWQLLTDKAEICKRWQRHHAKVLAADICTSLDGACPAETITPGETQFRPTFEQVAEQLRRTNGKKGLGPDNISAHVLHAGGKDTAQQLHKLISM